MSLSFDATFYQSQRPDVYNAFIATAGSTGQSWAEFAQAHYNTFGRFEGSDPSASFSTSYYLTTYPDIAAAGVNPFDHFLVSGSLEMRQPYSTFPTSSFVAADYAAANPDLAAAGITSDAALYQHWVIHGQFESRSGAPEVSIPNSGSTFTLSTDIDNLTGTAGDDVFNGVNGTTDTFTLPDTIDGGAGNDTLSLIVDTGGSVPAATVTNIENMEVRNTVALTVANSVDMGNFSSVTSYVANRNTAAVELDNVGTGLTGISMSGSRADVNVDTGAIETVNLALSNVADADNADFNINAATTAVTALNVSATSDSSLAILQSDEVTAATFAANGGSIEIEDWDEAAALKTLTTSGTSDVTFGDLTDAVALETVTHSGSGTANFDLGTGLAATVTAVTASGSGAIKVTSGANSTAITGGSGNDEIGIGGLIYSATAKVDGGAGTGDILAISDSTATIFTTAAKANISNFEILKVASAATETFDFEALTGLTGLIIDTATAGIVNNLSSSAAADVAVVGDQTTSLAVNVKDATNPGQNDTLKLSIDNTTADTDVDIAGFVAVGLETLQINSTGAGTQENSVELAGANDRLSTITITGDSNFELSDAASIGTEVSIDASAATGEISILMEQNASGQSITGSATAKNVIDGGLARDIIVGGAAVDTIDAGTGADKVTLGGGADTFKFTAADSVASSANVFAGANVAAGDTLTFGNGVDVITDFAAGSGGDIFDGGNAGAPTTGIGVAHAAGFVAATTWFLSGSYNSGSGLFTIAADGAGADTLVVEGAGATALDASTSAVVLVGVDSDDFVAANFI